MNLRVIALEIDSFFGHFRTHQQPEDLTVVLAQWELAAAQEASSQALVYRPQHP